MSKRTTPRDRRPPANTPAGRLNQVYGTDYEAALAALVELRVDLDDRQAVLVDLARRHGRSWEHIGGFLGITRQAAQHRYADAAGNVLHMRPGRSTGEGRRPERERRATDG